MAQDVSDRKDMEFVLYDVLNIETLLNTPKFEGITRKTLDMLITEARSLALKELLPINAIGDREGCRYENGSVRVPEAFHRAFQKYREGDWITLADDPEVGGQGMPVSVSLAVAEYFNAANCSFCMYPGLCHGAGKLIEIFGTDEQKKLYLPNMYSGKWGGSMLLTEPNAGSDVGALTTTAVPNPDGTYSISGNKIFITAGDQDLTENIIHPVLARIEGAPAGTAGISLFIVPKIWVNPDGSLGEPNDIVCTGIEEKMGIHGSATCSMSLGAKGKCRGVLLGEKNKGMRVMFHLMNEARLGVGLQAFAMASAAYRHAAQYARERVQGRSLLSMMDPAAPPVTIVHHPDVRRMLLSMKAFVEGMRTLIYYVGYCFDRKASETDPQLADLYNGMIEVLTPVVKAYCSERAFDVCTQAVQVHGGYGYTREYPVEQLLRDCKITSIYEGTNGIQAMDLLGRKLGMKKGAYFMRFISEMQKTAQEAKAIPGLDLLSSRFEKAVNRFSETAMHLGLSAMSEKVQTAFAFAHPFLMVTGDILLAWFHLWRAKTAAAKLEKMTGKQDEEAWKKAAETSKSEAAAYGVIQTANYFIRTELPITLGRMEAITDACPAAMEIPEAAFA